MDIEFRLPKGEAESLGVWAKNQKWDQFLAISPAAKALQAYAESPDYDYAIRLRITVTAY